MPGRFVPQIIWQAGRSGELCPVRHSCQYGSNLSESDVDNAQKLPGVERSEGKEPTKNKKTSTVMPFGLF